MRKTLYLLLAGAACGGAASCWAQTPEPGLMPDGSYDMYAGLGVRSAPNYEGGGERKQRVMPVLQAGWSNGAFISGMNAGWHWSSTPGLEYGPLLSVHPGRSRHGSTLLDGAISLNADQAIAASAGVHWGRASYRLRDIGARVEGGFFVNYYLAERLRITNNVLVGAGEERNGARWTVDVQRGAIEPAPHHTLALSAGATIGNRTYNTAYFGLRSEDVLSFMPVVISVDGKLPPPAPKWAYAASGGIKDLHAGVRWNWAMSPSWMLVTNVQVTQLRGGARNSPLTERATGVSVSTALAYRF
jgi:outer membrane scaffolding protein for murein synthesis (MipA/OmpV family)